MIWTVIIATGIGTFLLRFSFLALLGKRALPEGLLRLLRYTPVAVIPGLMAPQIFLPALGSTGPDPVKLVAALVTVAVGVWFRNVIGAMVAGIATLSVLLWLLP
ncbi:AzlD domain-containing protein [Pararhodobacter sp.]|uniref:AzlD domain-containing protein n=1 Tax=Pararhodobacter sp. TaxID=2127056 RepID=UPI002AFF76A9|nr:AzlD domain-containing protein [Pararhodobacter sp.]